MSLSYVPTIAYCNMFSIFYLEIISTTKLVAGKSKSDSNLGMAVNSCISLFYFILFLLVIVTQAISSSDQIAIEIFFIKNWYQMMSPFVNTPKIQFTIFDFSMTILCVILFIHCLMNLYIAKESALIFADEQHTRSLSQLLDLKR